MTDDTIQDTGLNCMKKFYKGVYVKEYLKI